MVIAVTGQLLANRYELREKLGSGGVSTVYRAWDMLRNTEIAVKIIHPHLVENELIVQQFGQEIAITRKISHPGIVQYYEMLEYQGKTFLTLEYLSGGDLKMRIRDGGPLPVTEAARIGEQILMSMQAAHEKGVIHCDIKPHNILFDSEGHSRITDFGFARSSLSLEQMGQRNAGTPDYAAPEVALSGFPDARSDLYSFGITLFEMLTGKLPFQSNNPHETLWKHANAPPPSTRSQESGVPEILDLVIQKSLAKNPSDRFQTAAEFAEALTHLTLPTKRVSAATHSCIHCGGVVLDALPYCFSCVRTEVKLFSSADRRTTHSVVVHGPGKPGDRLDPELRHRIMSFVESLGAESPRIEKRIPRLPFVLFRDLSFESAENVKGELTQYGMSVGVIGKDSLSFRKKAFRLFNRKLLALYPRYLLIGLGSAGGMWQIVGKASPWLLIGVLIAITAIIPTALRVSFKKPLATRQKGIEMSPLSLLLPLAQRVRTDQFRHLIGRIAEKFDILYGSLKQSVNEEGSEGLTASVLDSTLSEIVELFEGVIELEGELIKIDAMGINEKYRAAVSKLAAPGDSSTRQDLQQDLSGYKEAFRVRRNIENTLQQHIDRILRFSVGIDHLSTVLAGVAQGKARLLEAEMKKLSDTLVLEAVSLRELSDR